MQWSEWEAGDLNEVSRLGHLKSTLKLLTREDAVDTVSSSDATGCHTRDFIEVA